MKNDGGGNEKLWVSQIMTVDDLGARGVCLFIKPTPNFSMISWVDFVPPHGISMCSGNVLR